MIGGMLVECFVVTMQNWAGVSAEFQLVLAWKTEISNTLRFDCLKTADCSCVLKYGQDR